MNPTTSINSSHSNRNSTDLPAYTIPWKVVALAVSGVVCILFSAAALVAGSPLLSGASALIGSIFFIKSVSEYKQNKLIRILLGQFREIRLNSKTAHEKAREFVKIINTTFSENELKNKKITTLINNELGQFNFSSEIVQKVHLCIKTHSGFSYSVELIPGISVNVM